MLGCLHVRLRVQDTEDETRKKTEEQGNNPCLHPVVISAFLVTSQVSFYGYSGCVESRHALSKRHSRPLNAHVGFVRFPNLGA